MKILHLVNIYQKGSVAKIITTLQNHRSKGFSYRVMAFDAPKNPLSPNESLPCDIVGTRLNILVVKSVLSRIRKENKIDCIHVHMGWAMAVAPWLSYALKIPCVITFHNELKHYNVIVRIMLKFRHKLLSYTGVSKSVSSQWSSHLNCSVRTIYNPVLVDNANGQYEKEKQEKGKVRLVVVARLVKQKQLHLALELVSALLKKKLYVHLDIVGDGPEREHLETLVSKLRIREHCKFHGYQLNVVPWLDSADFFFLPSKYEGFCMAAVEALARGCILLTHQLPAVMEYAKDGLNAIIVNDMEIEGFSSRLVEVISNPKKLVEMKECAIFSVSQIFDANIITLQYESVYNRSVAQL